MKIRPLHKTLAGNYISRDEEWLFIGTFLSTSAKTREWNVYQRMSDGLFYKDTPYFYSSYPTLKSLIKSLEKPEKKK